MKMNIGFSYSIRRSFMIVFGISIVLLLIYLHYPGTIYQHRNIPGSSSTNSFFSQNNFNDIWIITTENQFKYISSDNIKDWSLHFTKNSDKCDGFQYSSLRLSTLATVMRGARYIYLTSIVDNRTSHILNSFTYKEYISVLKYNGTLDDPVSTHFNGIETINGLNRATSFSYNLGVWKTPLIQKVLKRGEIYNRNNMQKIDSRTPPLVLPPGKTFAFLRNGVLFHYDAFWSIVPIRVETLWSLWVQRLLLELDSGVLFKTIQKTSDNYNCGVKRNVSKQISKQFSNWTCEKPTSLFMCIRSLNQYMISKAMIARDEARDIEEWLQDLIKNGYMQPKLSNKSNHQQSLQPVNKVIFYPSVFRPQSYLHKTIQIVCPSGISKCPSPTATKLLSNILLLVVFNRSTFYYIVDHIETLYRPFFSQILFCGMNLDKYLPYFDKLEMPVSFVEMHKEFHEGQRGYRCLEAAMEMTYDVEGYLHIGDDILLNVWNLPGIPTDRIWFQKSLRVANLSQPIVPNVWIGPSWWPWTIAKIGRIPLTKTFQTIKHLSKENKMAKSFINQVAHNAGGIEKAFYEVSDIFYFPKRFSEAFLYLVKLFDMNGVYHEITIPTIISGLVKHKDIFTLDGSYLWGEDRKMYTLREKYNNSHIFLHALKIGPCYKDENCKSFLCWKYLPCLQ